jgi:ferredoxin-NADP reductase
MWLRVESIRRAAAGVVVLELADQDGRELPDWEPGSHLELTLPSGLVRHYSLCGPASGRDSYQVAVLRVPDGKGGSREIHDTGLVGRTLLVRGPRNRFPLVDASHYLLLAGGIGITPLLPMARTLARQMSPFRLIYGARSAESFAFRAELAALSPAAEFVPEDVSGRPDLARALDQCPEGTAVYCCGPEPMIAAVERLVSELRGRVALYVERFASSGSAEAVRPGDGAFELVLKQSGHTLIVPADRTALEVVREAVPGHPYSCLAGECGSCEVRVLEGVVDHRDEVLSDSERAENSAMMLCVSRAGSSRLVVDL